MLLFINSIIDGDFAAFFQNLQVAGIMGMVVLGAIAIDLVSGVAKAKRLGIARTSVGLRETVKKIIQYLTVMLFGLMLDILMSRISDWPYVTMGLCIGLVVIEGISVWEKAEVKLKKKIGDNVETIASLLENVNDKEAMLKAIAKILKEKADDQRTEE